jgi:hypothetical protein
MMALVVRKVEKKAKLSREVLVKYQILTYCFLNDIQVSDADLNSLALLAHIGEPELTEFCLTVSDKNIFKSPQSARNAITKAEKKKLIIKNGKNKKTIRLNLDIEVYCDGTIFLEYKFLGIESEKS